MTSQKAQTFLLYLLVLGGDAFWSISSISSMHSERVANCVSFITSAASTTTKTLLLSYMFLSCTEREERKSRAPSMTCVLRNKPKQRVEKTVRDGERDKREVSHSWCVNKDSVNVSAHTRDIQHYKTVGSTLGRLHAPEYVAISSLIDPSLPA